MPTGLCKISKRLTSVVVVAYEGDRMLELSPETYQQKRYLPPLDDLPICTLEELASLRRMRKQTEDH